MKSIVKDAFEYAERQHRITNHEYDDQPYTVHLEMVFYTGIKFIHLTPKEWQETLLACCWLHDVIEDCRITYNDLVGDFNPTVANIVYALTNEKGKNRAERANGKYYQGIVEQENAVFVKLCDRIANVEYSKSQNAIGGMFRKYDKENKDFLIKLKLWDDKQNIYNYNSPYMDMAVYLSELFKD